jgi:hypothetical protein
LSERRELIFVGGAAHSGSSAVARLLDAHPRLAALPAGARFLSDARGMPALLAGQLAPDEFAGRFRERWWDGAGGVGEERDPAPAERQLARFRDAYHRDPLSACRELFSSLAAPAGGERALVDASPGNLRQAQALVRLFPAARFVHVVRDGRDVAAAARDGSGMAAGIRRWTAKLREIDAAIRGEEDGAAHPVAPERLCLVVLDQLVAGEREASYEALLGRLGLDDDPAVRWVLDQSLGPEQVGRGRWRERARGPAAWALGRRYRRALNGLAREGNHAAGPLLEAYEALG